MRSQVATLKCSEQNQKSHWISELADSPWVASYSSSTHACGYPVLCAVHVQLQPVMLCSRNKPDSPSHMLWLTQAAQ